MIRLHLMNGKEVEVSQEEMAEFITQVLIPNPHWRHSGLLAPMEYVRYVQGRSTPDEFLKVARYLLVYIENLSFTGYLFDKAEGQPDRTKEFNMPVIKKLRELYQLSREMAICRSDLAGNVHEMENQCRGIGADPM